MENFDSYDWKHFHDVVFHATGESLSQDKLVEVYNTLPDNLKLMAEDYGMSDTVFRDNSIVWLMKQK